MLAQGRWDEGERGSSWRCWNDISFLLLAGNSDVGFSRAGLC